MDEMSSVADQKRKLSNPANRRVSTNIPERQSFACLLKSAVVMSWTDLISDCPLGIVHLDCRFGDKNLVDHLTIWVATERGEWRLVGEHSISRAKRSLTGISFENNYRPEKLAHMLDTILEHQHSFAPLGNQGRDGLIEVEQPTTGERRMAESTIATMLRCLQNG